MKSPRVVRSQASVPAEQPLDSQQDEPQASADVVRPMPRRQVSHALTEIEVALPRARRVTFKAGFFRAISRLFVWLWGFLRFYSGNIVDSLRGRSSVQTRAIRLRRAFERGGPTFAKLAQQLSMRADMLPYAYCAELSKMLDSAAAFPTEKAIKIIERSFGQPLSERVQGVRSEARSARPHSLACTRRS